MQVSCVLEPLPSPYTATALDGRVIARVTHRSEPVTLITSGNHSEPISFLVITASRTPMVLGYHWLRRHNPQIDRVQGKVGSWSSHCHSLSLKWALAPGVSSATPRSPPAPSNLSGVPELYHDLCEVSSKENALTLPPTGPMTVPSGC